MIIDTKGFEIGDEVWYCSNFLGDISLESFKISEFHITNNNIFAVGRNNKSILSDNCNIIYLYHTEQECQLSCDKLNSKL